MRYGKTHHQENADRQKEAIRRKVSEGCRAIRNEIIASYDPKQGNYSYPYNRGSLTEAEVLRRCGVNKNTIKKPYHIKARRAIQRLCSWSKLKMLLDKPRPIRDNIKSQLTIAWAERDAIAERLAVLEYLFQDLQRENAELRKNLGLKPSNRDRL